VKISAVLLLFVALPLGLSAQVKDAGVQKSATASQAQTAAPPAKVDDAKSDKKIDPAKEAAIRHFFEAQGTRSAMQETLEGMTGNMRSMLTTSLPPGDYREKLIELFIVKFKSKVNVDDLMEMLVPVYDKYYTIEDLQEIEKFYRTPTGKKMIASMPKVIVETQSISLKWGEDLGRASMLEVMNEHPELGKALEDAAAQAPHN
jgi:uncharacterized protein